MENNANINPSKLSDKIKDVLQRQVGLELHASQLYLSFEITANVLQLNGAEKFYAKQAIEERDHMKKVLEYLVDKGCMPKINKADEFPCTCGTLHEMLLQTLEAEKKVTNSWKQVCELSLNDKDYQTYELGLWFVKEQVHEESIISDLLVMCKTFGHDNVATMIVDKKMSEL